MPQHSKSSAPRYCIISPCRDEADYVRRTLDSVLNQSLPPACWIIVDDGSTDGTDAILREYERLHPCIKVIRRADRGRRQVGPGVVDAFYEGYDAIDKNDFEYICKLDVDLDLPPRYFEILIQRMEENLRIGTCSGKPYFRSGGRLVSEACGDENSVGMTKLFRLSCFRDIGGFVREVMWDGIDGHRCRLLGWVAVSWDEPDLRFEHLRVMGSSQNGIWTGRKRHGYGQWFMGTGLGYMIASAMFRMTRHPLLIGGLAMLAGYLGAMLRRAPRYGDAEFRAFLRRYQWSCLLRGKNAATQHLNEARHHVWLDRQAQGSKDEQPQWG